MEVEEVPKIDKQDSKKALKVSKGGIHKQRGKRLVNAYKYFGSVVVNQI